MNKVASFSIQFAQRNLKHSREVFTLRIGFLGEVPITTRKSMGTLLLLKCHDLKTFVPKVIDGKIVGDMGLPN